MRLLTDGAGAVSATAQYDAFGAPRSSTGTQLPFGFVGAVGLLTDPESGRVVGPGCIFETARGRGQPTPPGRPAPSAGWTGGTSAGGMPIVSALTVGIVGVAVLVAVTVSSPVLIAIAVGVTLNGLATQAAEGGQASTGQVVTAAHPILLLRPSFGHSDSVLVRPCA